MGTGQCMESMFYANYNDNCILAKIESDMIRGRNGLHGLGGIPRILPFTRAGG